MPSPTTPRAVALLLALAACARQDDAPVAAARAAPPRPAAGTDVAPGTLPAALEAAPEGAVLCLAPGRHEGPIVVRRKVTLWGPPDAVVAGSGRGTTVTVEAPGSALLGFTVDGSGTRFDLLDAAVHVAASDVRVEGLTVRGALFGILVQRAARVVVRGNEVVGTGQAAMGLRGDTIRLWEASDCTVADNFVRDGRDVVVWYSDRARVVRNTVLGGRYGTHFMFSRDSTVEGNSWVGNVVGLFVMYSHGIAVRDNLVSRCTGAAGIGIGLKESGNLAIERNRLIANTVGMFFDSSPLDPDEHNRVAENVVRLSGTAIHFHGGAARNRFLANTFRDNHHQVRVDGGGDALAAEWLGNAWDDYQGYDLDGDGTGDLPYEVRSLATQLTGKYPDLAFFHGTPALFLVDLTGKAMPMFRPKTLLVDRAPRVGKDVDAR
ncbi:MAG TPA: nitrous oxide reductase family maturation protein NosD [Planctomycetota bacterium]|nr:nitrous oxide reductase family maturation protein NosD [Planctomycetota bacterium]